MKSAEHLAIKSGVTGFQLMERAGKAVAEFVHHNWPAGRIQVLCGPGGNGGDGFIAAAELKRRWRDVDVYALLEPAALAGDAAKAAATWAGPAYPLGKALEAPGDLVIDALFGGGLSRPLEGVACELSKREAQVISVDVPSGLDGLTGQALGSCFHAAATVTFEALRPAHVLYPGLTHCGRLAVARIGVPINADAFENSPGLWQHLLPHPGDGTHKHMRGHLQVVSGPASRTGAARLSARAGLRAGAGLVTVLSPPSALLINASHLTAEMLVSLEKPDSFEVACRAAQVVILGPAAGVSEDTSSRLVSLLNSPARAVLDADALTVMAQDPAQWLAKLRPEDLMTPHIGEFNRLFPGLFESSVNKIEATHEAARRAGCTILLKGADTVIASPESGVRVNTHATSWLATAGAGDVLAGIAGGLMAQGTATFEAASMASWIHGEAGRRLGPGLIATDLEGQIPGVLQGLLVGA